MISQFFIHDYNRKKLVINTKPINDKAKLMMNNIASFITNNSSSINNITNSRGKK